MYLYFSLSKIITKLDIGNNGLGDEGIQQVITALNSNKVNFLCSNNTFINVFIWFIDPQNTQSFWQSIWC